MAWKVETKCQRCGTKSDVIVVCARDAISHQAFGTINYCSNCSSFVEKDVYISNVRRCRKCKGTGCKSCDDVGFVLPKSHPTKYALDQCASARSTEIFHTRRWYCHRNFIYPSHWKVICLKFWNTQLVAYASKLQTVLGILKVWTGLNLKFVLLA
jgi:hypothetical protein